MIERKKHPPWLVRVNGKSKINLTTMIFLFLLIVLFIVHHAIVIIFGIHFNFLDSRLFWVFMPVVIASGFYALNPIALVPAVVLILASVGLRKRLPWWIFLLEALLIVTSLLQFLIFGIPGIDIPPLL